MPPLLTAKVPVIPVVNGKPVQLVSVPDVGVPNIGVTSVGDVANTREPEPVSSVTVVLKLAEDGVARNVAMPVASPLTPVLIGNPVQFVNVPDVGVPSIGVTSVGLVANTSEPVPVSSVTAARRLAELGVARNVATPVPRPDTPVEIGRPVQLVKVPDVGVPKSGVTNVGDVAKTKEPEPVSLVTADAKFAELGVAKKVAIPVPKPETPVEIGSPVQLVSVPDVGVPRMGVTNVGLVASTIEPVPVTALKPVYLALHDAALVPDVRITVNIAAELATIAKIVLAPEDCTVTTPLLLFTIKYCSPSARVLVTGKITV